ncbi:hypothetical protein FKM82_029169 [Ascaphus truei]
MVTRGGYPRLRSSKDRLCFCSYPYTSGSQTTVHLGRGCLRRRAGAILSQRRTPQARLHLCAFYTKNISPAEQNYDVGNRELLPSS